MITTIYDHLLTCELRSGVMDNMVFKLQDTWEKSHILNNPPTLYGPSPSVTLPQVAFLLASHDQFTEKFLRPDMVRLFRLALNEAKSSLVSHCRTNPTIDSILRTAMVAQTHEIGTDLTQEDDVFDENLDDNDNDDDGGDRTRF
jgi:hypothetical protein